MIPRPWPDVRPVLEEILNKKLPGRDPTQFVRELSTWPPHLQKRVGIRRIGLRAFIGAGGAGFRSSFTWRVTDDKTIFVLTHLRPAAANHHLIYIDTAPTGSTLPAIDLDLQPPPATGLGKAGGSTGIAGLETLVRNGVAAYAIVNELANENVLGERNLECALPVVLVNAADAIGNISLCCQQTVDNVALDFSWQGYLIGRTLQL